MPPIIRRNYYHYVEKDPLLISPWWKVFTVLIFALLVASSLVQAYAFHDIFDSFSFRCILFSHLVFKMEDYQYLNHTPIHVETEMRRASFKRHMMLSNDSSLVFNEGQCWMKNKTMMARVGVDYRESAFGVVGYCNVVLFFPLSELVLASFAAVIVLMCRRGGRAYKSDIFPTPWVYVYPLTIFSGIMTISSIFISNCLRNGMNQFCASFESYTGSRRCTAKINCFTDSKGFGTPTFYTMYQISLYTSSIQSVLWVVQAALLILRVLCVVDFQLRIIKLKCRRRPSLDFGEASGSIEPLRRSQKTVSFPIPKSISMDYRDNDDQPPAPSTL